MGTSYSLDASRLVDSNLVRKNTRKWKLVAERVGPVKIPKKPNAFYVDIWRDESGATFATGAFPGAYKL